MGAVARDDFGAGSVGTYSEGVPPPGGAVAGGAVDPHDVAVAFAVADQVLQVGADPHVDDARLGRGGAFVGRAGVWRTPGFHGVAGWV